MEYTNSQIEELISEHIHSDKNRRILRRRLIDGVSYDSIAEELDMSVRWVKVIVARGKSILFKNL